MTAPTEAGAILWTRRHHTAEADLYDTVEEAHEAHDRLAGILGAKRVRLTTDGRRP